MTSSEPIEGRCNAKTNDGNYCENYPVEGKERCRLHGGKSTGPKTEEGKSQVAGNAVKHGLHTSKEVFLEHAEDHHRDTFHAIHESLCTDYEMQHGRLPTHIEKKLADIALDMVRLDMGDEYEAENAVDESKPLTEMRKEMTESGPWEKEVTSKIEQIKTNIARETRLTLKDMGIYNSPEKQQAEAMEKTLSEVLEGS